MDYRRGVMFRMRVGMCGKKCVDVIKAIKDDKKICVDATRFSRAVRGLDDTPSAKRICEAAEEIVTKWETEQGRVWDDKAIGFN